MIRVTEFAIFEDGRRNVARNTVLLQVRFAQCVVLAVTATKAHF